MDTFARRIIRHAIGPIATNRVGQVLLDTTNSGLGLCPRNYVFHFLGHNAEKEQMISRFMPIDAFLPSLINKL
jgi:hypothetical protein